MYIVFLENEQVALNHMQMTINLKCYVRMINIIKIARRFELRKSRNYQPTLGEED